MTDLSIDPFETKAYGKFAREQMAVSSPASPPGSTA
jgi:hypothetical protein